VRDFSKIQPIAQTNSELCWFACYTMLYQWQKGVTTKKAETAVETAMKGAGINTGVGLPTDKFGAACKALDLNWCFAAQVYGFDLLKVALSTYGPLLVSEATLDKQGNVMANDPDSHAILVYGFDPDTKNYGFYDPWSDSPRTSSDALLERWDIFSALAKRL